MPITKPSFRHRRRYRLRDDCVPLLVRDVFEPVEVSHGGVVKERVDSAKSAHRKIESRLVDCICVATSRRLFSKPSWLRFSRINDGVSKTFPLFVGYFVTQGASIVLLGMSPIVEISDS